MKYLYLNFLAILINATPSFTQTIRTPKTPILSLLYSNKNEISQINTPRRTSYVHISNNKKNIFQNLLKTKSGLYLIVEGTGQVYKATDTNNSEIFFTRIDSTLDYGNSYLSINFSYKDTLYSYGGYGFWRINGQLRYFNDNEWSIIKLNKEYKLTNEAVNYLPKKSQLYALTNITNDEAEINKKSENQYVIKLNLATKENEILGKLNPYLSFIRKTQGCNIVNIEALNGTLFEDFETRECFLINFEENRIYKLKSEKRNILFKNSKDVFKSLFEINGTLYYEYSNNKLDSTKISIDDFIIIPEPVYFNNIAPIFTNRLIISLFVILLILLSVVLLRSKGNIKCFLKLTKYDPIPQNNIALDLAFSEIDQQLIELIYSKCQKGNSASVEEVNNCLGISKKTIEIQKRVRTEVINKLNHKFKIICDNQNDIINRIRSEEDRRYFRYTINKDSYKLFIDYLK